MTTPDIAGLGEHLSNETEARLRAEVERNTAPFRTPEIERLREALAGMLKLADALSRAQVAEGVHTGLRKGTDAADAHQLWTAISKSQTTAWGDACDFFVETMKFGFGKEIAAARAALTGEGT